MDWRDQAVCVGQTALFFPADAETTRERITRIAAAKALCATCPVQKPCLQFALDGDERGIWGGTDERDRRRMLAPPRPPLIIARAERKPEQVGPAWRVVDSRESVTGAQIHLKIAETGRSWHGFEWAVFRDDDLAFLADNEPDAFIYFHSLVIA